MKEELWLQLGASIDTLEEVISLCPDEEWEQEEFWYLAYHSLFFLDYYLTKNPAFFVPPEPFTESEFEDQPPPRVYSKEELLSYLKYCRAKARQLLAMSDRELLEGRWVNSSGSMNYSYFEICLYNMRHVQHHAAQLNRQLRQHIDKTADWLSRASDHL